MPGSIGSRRTRPRLIWQHDGASAGSASTWASIEFRLTFPGTDLTSDSTEFLSARRRRRPHRHPRLLPGTCNDAGIVAVTSADQGDNASRGVGGADSRGDDGEPLVLRFVQRRPDDPGNRIGAGGSIRSARTLSPSAFAELFLVGDRILADPEVTADLGAVVLGRAS